jgi:SAM-dependent methyltransferase
MRDDPGVGREYLLSNREAAAGQRLSTLADLFDGNTFVHLTAVGVGRGWRCWEVGAGGPTVPAWLAARTGVDVLATDIDVSWLDAAPGVVVRRHDIARDPLPGNDFDLIHARLVLVHVPQRDAALATMVSALRPGGVLVIEDADPALQPLVCLDETGPAQRLANKLKRDFRTLMADRGADLAFGRTLPRRLRAVGLVDVRADSYFPVGGVANTALEVATIHQIRDRLIDGGLATAAEIDQHLANLAAGETGDLVTSPMITAWGRKPEKTP